MYIDGSSGLVYGVCGGRFGVVYDSGRIFAFFFPSKIPKQIFALSFGRLFGCCNRITRVSTRCFCTHCNVAFLGFTGGAARWRRHG